LRETSEKQADYQVTPGKQIKMNSRPPAADSSRSTPA
jgi:hypothetical protein